MTSKVRNARLQLAERVLSEISAFKAAQALAARRAQDADLKKAYQQGLASILQGRMETPGVSQSDNLETVANIWDKGKEVKRRINQNEKRFKKRFNREFPFFQHLANRGAKNADHPDNLKDR